MADFEAKVGVNFDTSNAIAAIKQLQSQLADLNRSLTQGSNINAAAAKNFQRNLIADINTSGKFVARMQQIRSTTEQFTDALERNKLSMGQYFRYAASTTKTFGNKFSTELKTIEKVARERVKSLQTQYIALGRDANGALQSIAVRPLKLDLNDLATKQAIVAQKQQIFNQLLKQGSTNLLNFGKNTQWAGRQLMVGFTIPLSIFGAQASKTFMSLEEQAIKFRRVYGELFTPPGEADKMLDSLKEIGTELTKYGVSLEDTLSLAGDVAAMGKTGADLLAQVEQATRLAVLGNVDQQKALEASISITNAFGIAAEDLADKINFLNAVENQTVLSIEDLTTAIPKAGPVVQQLGGSVEDLAFFMTAMKEGGINASEGANALKSGLAKIINPTEKASTMLKGLGININKIVEDNAGDIKATILELSAGLDSLDPLNRARAIEELFGRFQFARISTLFQNIAREGTQASRVLDLTNSSLSDLANLSEKELGAVADSTTFEFKKAIEQFQIAIAPIGEQFLKAVTPIIEFATGIIKRFDSMSDGAKNFVVILTAVLGAVAPVALMTFGLVANGVANLIKGFAAVRGMFLKTSQDSTILGGQMEYLTQEQIQAGAVAASLEQSHQRLTQQFTAEASAVDMLAQSYGRAIVAGRGLISGGTIQTALGQNAKKYASGGIVSGKGTGTSDSIMAMVSNGEAIIPADVVRKNPAFFQSLISGNIPGFAKGGVVGVGGKEYAVPDGRSVKALQQMIDKLSQAGHSIETITAILDRMEDQSSMTAAALREEIKSRNLMPKAGTDGVARAHLTMPRDGGDGFNYLSGLTRETSKSQNIALRTGQQKDEFLQEWQSRTGGLNAAGQAGLRQTGVLAANAPLSQEHITALQQLDNEIGNLAAELAVDGLVSDTELAKAAEIVISKAKDAPGARGEAARALEERRTTETARRTKIDTKEINKGIASGDVTLRAGSVTLVDSKGKTVGRVSDSDRRLAMSAGSEQEKRAILMAARKKSSTEGLAGTRAYTGYKQMSTSAGSKQLEKQGEKDEKAYNKGRSKVKPKDAYERNRNRKSPHAKAAPDGKDDAKAYSDSFNQTIKKTGPRRAQSSNADAASSTPVKKTGPRRASAPQQTASRDAALKAKADREAAAAAEKAAVSNRRMTRASNGALYALTSLAGMASMAGGQIGEVAQTMFMITAGMTALNAVMGIFTEKTLIQLAVDRFRLAQSALENASKAGSIVATNVFTASVAKAGIAVNAFMGPLGWGILALTAAIAGFIFVSGKIAESQKKAKDNIDGLSAASKIAATDLANIASLVLGREVVGPAVGSVGVKSEVAEKAAAVTPENLSQFQGTIDLLKNVTDPNIIQDQVNQLMVVLKSMQLSDDDAQAVILAILKQAEKSAATVEFDFDVTIKDLDEKINAAMADFDVDEYNRLSDIVNSSVGDKYTRDSARAELVKMRDVLVNDIAGTAGAALLSLSAQFAAGAIDVNSALGQVSGYTDKIKELNGVAQDEAIVKLAENLSIDPELVKDIGDADLALQMLALTALDVDIPETLLDSLNNFEMGEDPAALRIKTRLMRQLRRELEKAEEARKNAPIEEQQKQAEIDLSSVEAMIEAKKEENTVYQEAYEKLGDQEKALEIATDATLRQALASAILADQMAGVKEGTEDATSAVWQFWQAMNELDSIPDLPELGGSGEANPFQSAMESLKSQRDEIRNTSVAYTRLRQAGFGISSSARLAADSTLALALATTKVGTAKYKELLSIIEEIDVASRKNAIKDLVAERSADIQLKSQFLDSYDILVEMGYEAQDIMNILDNPDLAKEFIADLKDGKLDSKQLLNYLKQIALLKKIDVEVRLSTPEGQWSEIETQFGNVQNWFKNQEAAIDVKFRPQIETQEDIIKKAQEDIDDLNEKLYENEYQLEGITLKENEINKKYEARTKALDEIVAINKVIQAQEKGSLSVADALTQGDIAAAARAAQEARVATAAAVAEDKKQLLDLAKEKELAAVRSADGRSRADIEKEIEGYKAEISKIEHDRVKPAEKLRDAAIATRDAEKSALDYLGLSKTAWGDLETAANKARVEAEAYKKAIEEAMLLLAGASGGKVTLPEGYTGSKSTAEDNQKEIDELNRLRAISRKKYYESDDPAYKQRLYDINVARGKKIKELGGVPLAKGGVVPKYFAAGGFTRGTDTVPAMLTPGEFVVRRSSVRNFGVDRLKAINSGTYGGDSVYNYNLTVSVKSDANPDQIANTVMSKLKQVESKRMRGGRF